MELAHVGGLGAHAAAAYPSVDMYYLRMVVHPSDKTCTQLTGTYTGKAIQTHVDANTVTVIVSTSSVVTVSLMEAAAEH